MSADERHRELQDEAVRLEGEAHRLLLDGERERAARILLAAAERYRESWELAPPGGFGRLVGMLKASILAGEGGDQARYVRGALGGHGPSPTAWYASGVAALLEEDDDLARAAAEGMVPGGEPFARAAAALLALANRRSEDYAGAVQAIVADFEGREQHLTGVPFADTALMFERLAERRGMAAGVRSSMLPPA